MSEIVSMGKMVKIHYVGKLEDGTIFDTSLGGDPLEFVVGSGSIIKGVDSAVIGMRVGEKKVVTVTPEEGYGPRYDQLVKEVPRDELPPGFDPQVGQRLSAETTSGQHIVVTVTNVTDESITIDANHPLAGKKLEFEIEVVGIE